MRSLRAAVRSARKRKAPMILTYSIGRWLGSIRPASTPRQRGLPNSNLPSRKGWRIECRPNRRLPSPETGAAAGIAGCANTCIGMSLIGSAYAMRHHLKTRRAKDKCAGDLLAMAKTADVMINNLEDPDGLRHEV